MPSKNQVLHKFNLCKSTMYHCYKDTITSQANESNFEKIDLW